MSVEAFVFDVDDTLYLERDYVRSGFSAVGTWARNEGLPDVSGTCWAMFNQGLRGNVFDLALAHHGVGQSPGLVDTMVQVYRTHRPEIELLVDAKRSLSDLSGLGYPIAVLTGGPVRSQERKVEALGLGDLCDPIVYSGCWGPAFDKPSTRAFRIVEELTGLTSSQLCYVADNPARDFPGTLKRNWKVVRIRRSSGLHFEVDSDVPERGELDAHELVALAEIATARR